jgi:hypothetical protein
MRDREELRAAAAQCLALAKSTTDPRTRTALTIMAQNLYDLTNRRSAEYELAEREFNYRQMLPQPAMQQQPKKK